MRIEGGAGNVRVFVVRTWQVKILDKAVYISLCAITLGKGMCPSVPPENSRSDSMVWQPV